MADTVADSPQRYIPGVIGGLGPDATLDFLQIVMKLTPAERDQDHLRLLIDQNPGVPNRQDAILSDGMSPSPALAAMAAGLERSGADFLVMPCNTAHAYASEIQSAISVPLLSIVDTAIDVAVSGGATQIGVLETPACRHTRLYEKALLSRGIGYIESSAQHCEALMRLAYEVKRGQRSAELASEARRLAQELHGADAIITGCTEIPLLLSAGDVEVPLVSSTEALARRTIAVACSQAPLPSI